MPKTAHFEWETPVLADEADIPADLAQLANEIEEDLQGLDVAELGTAGAGDSGKLLIVQGTGAAAWKAMSGDATISTAGAITIANEKITSAKIALLAITEALLAGEAVSTAKIKLLAVTAARLAAEAVETAKLANLAVTEAKIANLAISTAKLGELSVTEAKIAALAVGTAKIANLAVTEGKLADGAVTSRKFKPTGGIEEVTASLALTTEFKDLTGASLAIAPAVASILKVTAVFDFVLNDNTGEGVTAYGTLNVDGVDSSAFAVHGVASGLGDNHISDATVVQVYRIPLTAAAHTIKQRAKKVGVGSGECIKVHSNFSYELVAS